MYVKGDETMLNERWRTCAWLWVWAVHLFASNQIVKGADYCLVCCTTANATRIPLIYTTRCLSAFYCHGYRAHSRYQVEAGNAFRAIGGTVEAHAVYRLCAVPTVLLYTKIVYIAGIMWNVIYDVVHVGCSNA